MIDTHFSLGLALGLILYWTIYYLKINRLLFFTLGILIILVSYDDISLLIPFTIIYIFGIISFLFDEAKLKSVVIQKELEFANCEVKDGNY